MEHGGLSRATVGEGLVQHIELPCSGSQILDKITQDDADSVRIRKPMWDDETQPFA